MTLRAFKFHARNAAIAVGSTGWPVLVCGWIDGWPLPLALATWGLLSVMMFSMATAAIYLDRT